MPLVPPTRLSIEDDGIAKCRLFDVYFNGEKQTRCCVADVAAGFVTRYTKMTFGVPQRDRNGRLTVKTDYGTVQIVAKGELPCSQ